MLCVFLKFILLRVGALCFVLCVACWNEERGTRNEERNDQRNEERGTKELMRVCVCACARVHYACVCVACARNVCA